jgi:hypothetical protein
MKQEQDSESECVNQIRNINDTADNIFLDSIKKTSFFICK